MPRTFRSLMVALLCVAGPAFAASGGVEVSDAWARATPPGAANGAVFFTLRNRGEVDDHLRQVATPVAKAAELHAHLMDAGVARMRQVPDILVPAKGSVVLEPGGLHVMLLSLQQPLKEGESIELVLHFDRSGERKLQVPVRRGQPSAH